jgi:hypothetical protein
MCHEPRQRAIYNIWDETSSVLNPTHFIAVNAPMKGQIKLAGTEPANCFSSCNKAKSRIPQNQKYLNNSPLAPSGKQTAAPNFSCTEDHVRERAVSADENAERAKRNP